MTNFEIFQSVYDLVRQIPVGGVSTYGRIATVLDINPRYVGYILHHNQDSDSVPCHRVVNADGRVAKTFALGGGDVQQKLLENEGVIFVRGKVEKRCIIEL